MNPTKIKIESSWNEVIREEFSKAYFQSLCEQISEEKKAGITIYPSEELIFEAFNRTPFSKLKAVIIGQDPYHNPNQAMGLCFSVPKSMKRPPSLLNIYKELHRDFGYEIPSHGDISYWADQGVLLLNAMLTVKENKPRSHRKIGWQQFTDTVIQTISNQKQNIVFLLWGNFAKGKKDLIDDQKHLILESAHPSPLAGKAFQGNGHFSKTNAYLEEHNKGLINWDVSQNLTTQLQLKL